MQPSEDDYILPKHLIAQTAVEPRDSSRLMIVDGERIEHRRFYEIIDFMNKGDALVLNNTRVIYAKLIGKKETGGKVEVLLIRRLENSYCWECLIKGKNIRVDTKIVFHRIFTKNPTKIDSVNQYQRALHKKISSPNAIQANVVERVQGGRYIVEFQTQDNIDEKLALIGMVPLPPYIKKELKNSERYQTVYATAKGSLAAPTAGLHFTDELLNNIKKKGVNVAYLTLHVGVGTFTLIKEKDTSQHKMEAEYYDIDEECAKTINTTKENGGELIAVGTSTMRALESACVGNSIKESEGWTELFIYPGYKFKSGVCKLLTNFHLPKSTPLILITAFGGKKTVYRAYDEAIKKEYRFYSFGDAMLVRFERMQ